MQKYFNTYRKVVVLLLMLLSLMGGVQSIGYSSLEIESGTLPRTTPWHHSETAQEIAAIALKSTVLIKTQSGVLGSGFVVDAGKIATNYHVIENMVSGTAQLVEDTTNYTVEGVLSVDIPRDLAIIKVSSLSAPSLPLGDSNAVEIGQDVYAAGNPQGLTGTFSAGIISAIRPEGNALVAGKVIQITAPISPGSSGGPVLDSNAEVIGIAVGQHTGGQNLNFAIPVNYLKDLLTRTGNVPISINDAPVLNQGATVPRSPSFSDLLAAFDAGNTSLAAELTAAAPEICVGLQFPRDTFARRVFRNRGGEVEDVLVFAHRSDGWGVGWLIIEDVIETSSSGIEADLFRFVKRGDVWVLTHFEGVPHCAPVGKPDLVIESVEAEPSTVEPGQVFKLSSTLRNNGTGVSAPTTVRYYRSTNDTISTTDTELDAFGRDPLDPNETIRRQLDVTAPTTPGTYYYGVCVDSVPNESNTANNCSAAVRITVERSSPEPTALTLISGDNQTGLAGDPLIEPFVVEVRDQYGDPMEGIAVSFAVTAGGGSLSDTSVDTDANGIAQSSLTLGIDAGTNTGEARVAGIDSVVMFTAVAELLEFTLSVPAGISLIHVPLNVTKVDSVAKTIESIYDLYDALGGAGVVTFLITYDPATEEWFSYFGASDKGSPADRALTAEMGIIANLITPTTVRLAGEALGTDGTNTMTLTPGINIVGLPLRDSRISRASDLLELPGISGNVPVIILTEGGDFRIIGRAGDPGDIPITGGQGFILTAQQAVTVTLSGEAWSNVSETAASPSVKVTGFRVTDTTPVLALRASIGDEVTGVNLAGFRVAVKNLSTPWATVHSADATVNGEDGVGYRLTIVDIKTARAAQVGDVLEISALSKNPFVRVNPLRYMVTAEDVKQSLIWLPELVAYELPAQTELLANYPNPFNPETWIPYRLAEDAFVTLTIYDAVGQVVRMIEVGHQIASAYENRSKAIYWDGRNESGESVASGVYFYHLAAGRYSVTRRMVILK